LKFVLGPLRENNEHRAGQNSVLWSFRPVGAGPSNGKLATFGARGKGIGRRSWQDESNFVALVIVSDLDFQIAGTVFVADDSFRTCVESSKWFPERNFVADFHLRALLI
jgi:hypothetical protein